MILFRGIVYRFSVKYTVIVERESVDVNDQGLKKWIAQNSPPANITYPDKIIDLALKLTSKRLAFTSHLAPNDPITVFKTGKANCIGYSAFFNTICNYLLNLNNLENDCYSIHLVGKMEFFGFDLHRLSQSPFFNDHDFNVIINKKTQHKTYIDPSLNDFFWISRISLK